MEVKTSCYLPGYPNSVDVFPWEELLCFQPRVASSTLFLHSLIPFPWHLKLLWQRDCEIWHLKSFLSEIEEAEIVIILSIIILINGKFHYPSLSFSSLQNKICVHFVSERGKMKPQWFHTGEAWLRNSNNYLKSQNFVAFFLMDLYWSFEKSVLIPQSLKRTLE